MLPVTAPPIRDGFVEIRDGRIAAIGECRALGPGADSVADLGDAILMPGFVNPHAHLELTAYAGALPPSSLWDWIEKLIRLRAQPGQVERETAGVAAGIAQMLRAGVTCVGDISRRNLAWRVLKRSPIRKVCFVELISNAEHAPRDIAGLQSAARAIEADDLLTVGVSPHAPYTVSAADLRGALLWAARENLPWCTHWAETAEEVALLQGEAIDGAPEILRRIVAQCGVDFPRQSPVAYLDRCAGAAAPGALAHCNYVADEELERLAAAGHTVVYCPRAHRFYGHSRHPFARMRRAGVRVAIGTDSAASNQGLSILDELRFVRDETDGPPSPPELLRMGTLDGAAALGLGAEIGSLELGKQADLAAFRCGADTRNPEEALLGGRCELAGLWVAGRPVAV